MLNEALEAAAKATFAKANEGNLKPETIESLWPSQHLPHWQGLAQAAITAYLEALLPAGVKEVVERLDGLIAGLGTTTALADDLSKILAALQAQAAEIAELHSRQAAWEETSLAVANLRNENGSLRGEIAALGTLVHELVNDLTCIRGERLPDWCKATGAIGDPVEAAHSFLTKEGRDNG